MKRITKLVAYFPIKSSFQALLWNGFHLVVGFWNIFCFNSAFNTCEGKEYISIRIPMILKKRLLLQLLTKVIILNLSSYLFFDCELIHVSLAVKWCVNFMELICLKRIFQINLVEFAQFAILWIYIDPDLLSSFRASVIIVQVWLINPFDANCPV